ncbi:hypothetical protein VTK73DRAFT_6820 [Phialemonium thermophilum]|uniref:Uncharacterized protein n=1 Tax=Phialemonium thermophilum TaxID=223376 RepID=A0ABR3Y776_9PEZI
MHLFGISLVATLLLAGASVAQPSGGRQRHERFKNRDVTSGKKTLTVVDESVTVPTLIPNEQVVYVNKAGDPVSTATEDVLFVPDPTEIPSNASVTGTFTGASATATQSAASSVPSGTAPSGTIPTGSVPTGGPILPGISYAAYNDDGSCKSADAILSDFQKLQGHFSLVRVYGVDCDQVGPVIQAAKAIGVKVMLGLFDLAGLNDQINTLINAVQANGGWSLVDTVSVGNELVNNGQASASQVVSAVKTTRAALRGAGYEGPVVTVDTQGAVLNNPVLCDASDYCAMNIHPFFDPNTAAPNAGTFIQDQVRNVRNVLANKNQRIVVTETGWPWQGAANGNAVPGKINQKTAIASIKSAYSGSDSANLILFSAFNDLWKKPSAGTFFAEQYWGINQF